MTRFPTVATLCLNRKMLSKLYPILDVTTFGEKLPQAGPERVIFLRNLMEELLAAGVSLLQYRNKLGNEAEVLADALALRTAAPLGRCVLILNDYPALVSQVGFDGVHVGQEDMAADRARELIGADKMLGVSTHNPEQSASAELTSADYLAVGPVFATSSKLNPDPVVGLEGVRLARLLTKKPLVAIGGITLANCKAVLEAGADSVAVISNLFADTSRRTPGKIASDFFVNLR
jgi:thiamine-phosphate pyrophosphorylase